MDTYSNFKIHAFAEADSTDWSGGRTTEFVIFPTGTQYTKRNFGFRISSATVETETSEFTSLPKYNRWLAVLEGELEIIHAGKYSKKLTTLENDSFHGSWQTSARGKVRDLNVIYSDNFELNVNLAFVCEPATIIRSSDFLFLFLLKDLVIEQKQLKTYDLLEVTGNEISLEAGTMYFRIELNFKA